MPGAAETGPGLTAADGLDGLTSPVTASTASRERDTVPGADALDAGAGLAAAEGVLADALALTSSARAAAPSAGRSETSRAPRTATSSASHAGQSARTVRTSDSPTPMCQPSFWARSCPWQARRPVNSSQVNSPTAYTSEAGPPPPALKRSGAM